MAEVEQGGEYFIAFNCGSVIVAVDNPDSVHILQVDVSKLVWRNNVAPVLNSTTKSPAATSSPIVGMGSRSNYVQAKRITFIIKPNV